MVKTSIAESPLPMVNLRVYDLLGREVAVLVNERRPAGTYEARFDAHGLASGLYICRLVVSDDIRTRSMVLIQ